ncbi:hypothetical protein Tcan_06480 [Toxocara canis]|uniref:Protein sleepless n=1 Tax=Toxocara canis TaxID=6265 RepID=A0A0B2VU68_TOXCA|nr:hypothetical protein Tcan_06480 [Toxocara canis]
MRSLFERLTCIFPLLNTGVLTLQCVSCSHSSSVVDATASKCDSRRFCEGKWCSQALHGERFVYGCNEASPFDATLLDIKSFCHFGGIQGQRLFAYCYCKDGNYCNSAQSSKLKLVPTVALFSLLLSYL